VLVELCGVDDVADSTHHAVVPMCCKVFQLLRSLQVLVELCGGDVADAVRTGGTSAMPKELLTAMQQQAMLVSAGGVQCQEVGCETPYVGWCSWSQHGQFEGCLDTPMKCVVRRCSSSADAVDSGACYEVGCLL
jgi:hypothetical protein